MGFFFPFRPLARFPPSLFTWLEGQCNNVLILNVSTILFQLILTNGNFKLQRTVKMVNTTGIRRGTRYMFSRDFRKRGKFFTKKALLIVLLGISRFLSDCFSNLLP